MGFGIVMASAALRRAFQQARTELKEYEALFLKYDTGSDGFLDLMELKYMMEKLGHPQTHLGLKAMIKEVDEDSDDLISYKEFLLIFRYAKTGQLKSEGLKAIPGHVNVDDVGVGGAKNFFEAKAKAINDCPAERDREYHEQRKREAQEKAQRQAAFKQQRALFQ